MLNIIMRFHHAAAEALERDISIDEITTLPIREEIGRMRYIGEEDLDKLDDIGTRAEKNVKALAEQSGEEG
jgi:V/A-type H+-transporting ATPase subunit A